MRLVAAPLLLVALLPFNACTRSTMLVAHRGASHLAPENTQAAFDLAWELGADAIEGDFYLTRDGQIVAHHDETTERTGSVDQRIEDQTLADLRTLDVGGWKGPQWAGEPIPTLEEVLGSVPRGKRILIEIKSGPTIVPILAGLIEGSDLDSAQMTVICFDERVIARVKERLPAIKAYWLSDFEEDDQGRWRPAAATLIATAYRIRADGVSVNANPEVLDEAFVRALRGAGLEFHVWTVNDPALARRMMSLGVDSITTDRPGWLREQVRR